MRPGSPASTLRSLRGERRTEGASIYNGLEAKQVTAWLAIRNAAAHGDYGDYDQAAVEGMVEGVGNFTSKYPA